MVADEDENVETVLNDSKHRRWIARVKSRFENVVFFNLKFSVCHRPGCQGEKGSVNAFLPWVRAPARYPHSRTRHHLHVLAVSETTSVSQLTSWPFPLDHLLSAFRHTNIHVHSNLESEPTARPDDTPALRSYWRRHALPRVPGPHTTP